MWQPEEELALPRCWVDVSEDSQKGNAQTFNNFWVTITKSWHKLMKHPNNDYHTKHQLASKWKDLIVKKCKFNGVYNNLANQRMNGQSDADIEGGTTPIPVGE